MNPTTTTTHPSAQNLTAVDGTFTGNIDVDGTANLDVVDIDGAVDMASTLAITGDTTLSRAETNGTVRLSLSNTGSNGSSEYSEIKLSSTAGTAATSIFQHRNNYGLNLGTTTNNAIYLLQNNSTHTTFETDGDVNINDGNLVVASGHGIDFSAASNDSEMTSELLDDYEEGLATMAFSPGAGSITINTSYEKLSYTKIGRMVHMNGQLAASAISSLGTGNYLQITGLPFAAENLDDNAGRCGFHVPHDACNMVDGREIFGFINEGGAVINIYEQNLNGASNKAEMVTATGSLYFSFTYNTAS